MSLENGRSRTIYAFNPAELGGTRCARSIFHPPWRHQQGCYSSMNMALHVGDDPEAVLANRQPLWNWQDTICRK